MAQMKNIVIKLQNGEELTPEEMAVVVESGVDIESYRKRKSETTFLHRLDFDVYEKNSPFETNSLFETK